MALFYRAPEDGVNGTQPRSWPPIRCKKQRDVVEELEQELGVLRLVTAPRGMHAREPQAMPDLSVVGKRAARLLDKLTLQRVVVLNERLPHRHGTPRYDSTSSWWVSDGGGTAVSPYPHVIVFLLMLVLSCDRGCESRDQRQQCMSS